MGNLSDIAKINVSTASVGIKQAGFGTILIVDYHTRFAERVRTYTTLDGMISDGFTVNDAAYKAAAAAFAQNPQPERVKIGRRANAPDLQVDLTPQVLNSKRYQVEITGPAGLTGTVYYDSDATATAAEIVAGLVSAINTAALGVTATNQTTFVRCKAASAGLWFGVKVSDLTLLDAQQTHADPGIAADLAAIVLADSDFYGLSLTTSCKAEVVAAASWVESNKRLMIIGSQDFDLLTGSTSDTASTLKTATQYRSKVLFGSDPRQFGAFAWLARNFAFDPGASTFEHQRLSSVSSEALTDTQFTNLKTKNGSAVIDYGGVGLTTNSKTAAGEWLDVIRDRDAFEADLQVRIVTTVANASAAGKKIPFTDAGASVLEADVRGALTAAIASGFLSGSPAPIVNVPTVASVSAPDRAARKFKPITFSAKIAGAIHATEITGTVTI